MRASEGVGLEPGDVDHGPVRMKRLELSQTPLRTEVRGPRSRSRDVVVLLPCPTFVGPPFAPAVATALDKGQVGGVRDRRAGDAITTHIGAVLWPLVVVGNLAGRRADRA